MSKNFLSDDATIFDIGANIGVTAAILATAAPRGHLFAFEPGAETYSYLLATINANHLSNCRSQQIALGKTSGKADFLSNAPVWGSQSHGI